MRRREKYIRNGAAIGGGLLAVYDVFNQMSEQNAKGEKLTMENFDWIRTMKKAGYGLAFGGTAGFLYYLYKIQKEKSIPFNADEYLEDIIRQEHLNTHPALLEKALRYREILKSQFYKEFEFQLAAFPLNAGSLFKRTAIVSGYDVDIILVFRKNAFSSLKEMYYTVKDFLEKKFGNKFEISAKSRSICLSFNDPSLHFKIDIVPGREINNYRKDKTLNLYLKSDWFFQRGSSQKINVTQQNKITCNQPEARKVIKLLKIYRHCYFPALSSAVIEQCVIEALDEKQFGLFGSLTENLLNCMDWLAKILGQNAFMDEANSNNNLLKKLDYFDKANIIQILENDISRVESNSRYLKDIFDN